MENTTYTPLFRSVFSLDRLHCGQIPIYDMDNLEDVPILWAQGRPREAALLKDMKFETTIPIKKSRENITLQMPPGYLIPTYEFSHCAEDPIVATNEALRKSDEAAVALLRYAANHAGGRSFNGSSEILLSLDLPTGLIIAHPDDSTWIETTLGLNCLSTDGSVCNTDDSNTIIKCRELCRGEFIFLPNTSISIAPMRSDMTTISVPGALCAAFFDIGLAIWKPTQVCRLVIEDFQLNQGD